MDQLGHTSSIAFDPVCTKIGFNYSSDDPGSSRTPRDERFPNNMHAVPSRYLSSVVLLAGGGILYINKMRNSSYKTSEMTTEKK
jgi:hypothetical protein